MSLEVTLDDASRIWRPGDRLTGSVRLVATTSIDVAHVTIAIRGLAQTGPIFENENTGDTTYRGNIVLFNDLVLLFDGPYTLQANTYDWRFTLSLPLNCEKRKHNYFMDTSQLFDDNPSQRLPPSFRDRSPSKRMAQDDVCSIVYFLRVELASRAVSSKHRIVDIPFPVRTHRIEQHPQIDFVTKMCTFTCRSLLLDKSRSSQSLSLGEKMKSRLNAASLPALSFSLLAQLPRAGILGCPIRIGLSLEKEAPAASIAMPRIDLTELTVTLTHLTTIRGLSGAPGKNFFIGATMKSWQKHRVLAKLAKPLSPCPDTIDLDGLLSLTLPSDCVPTFCTFNIAMAYALHVEATCECLGQKFYGSLTVDSFRVLEEWPGEGEGSAPPAFEQAPEATVFGAQSVSMPHQYSVVSSASEPSAPSAPSSTSQHGRDAVMSGTLEDVDVGTGDDALPAYEWHA